MKVRCLQCGIKEPHQKFMFKFHLQIGQRIRNGWICSGFCFKHYTKKQFKKELARAIKRADPNAD